MKRDMVKALQDVLPQQAANLHYAVEIVNARQQGIPAGRCNICGEPTMLGWKVGQGCEQPCCGGVYL